MTDINQTNATSFLNYTFDDLKGHAEGALKSTQVFAGETCKTVYGDECGLAQYAAGALVVVTAAYLAYRKICKKPAPTKPVESETAKLFRLEQERLQAFLKSKNITDCHLPPYINNVSKALEPILDPQTREIVDVEATKMQEAVKDKNCVPPCLAFYGPAGTGKTTLISTLPAKVGYATIHIDPALLQKYMQLGKAEELLMDIKQESELYAAKTGRPVMLILEDCEQLFAKRKSEAELIAERKPMAKWEENQLSAAQLFKQHQDAFVNALLRELGKEHDRRFSVGVTLNQNRTWIVDDALATRFKYILIPLPDEQHRKKILELHIPRYFNNDLSKMRFFDMGRLEQMALATEGFTGRNLIRVLEDIRSQMQLAEGDLNRGMVESAINKVAQSIEKPVSKDNQLTSTGAAAARVVANAVENAVDFTTTMGVKALEKGSKAVSRFKAYWAKPAATASVAVATEEEETVAPAV